MGSRVAVGSVEGWENYSAIIQAKVSPWAAATYLKLPAKFLDRFLSLVYSNVTSMAGLLRGLRMGGRKNGEKAL